MASRAQTYAGSDLIEATLVENDAVENTRNGVVVARGFWDGKHPVTNPAVTWWFRSWTKETMVKQKIKDIPGYDEMREKLFDWLSPEERLAGLTPEQVVPALPLEILRVLPDDYLRSLPPDIEQAVRRRMGRADD